MRFGNDLTGRAQRYRIKMNRINAIVLADGRITDSVPACLAGLLALDFKTETEPRACGIGAHGIIPRFMTGQFARDAN